MCYDVDGLVQDLSLEIVKAPTNHLTVTVTVSIKDVCSYSLGDVPQVVCKVSV